MTHTGRPGPALDELRTRLAEAGVPLFVHARRRTRDDDVAALLASLVRSGDPRLAAAAGCLLLALPGDAGTALDAARRACAALDDAERLVLGTVYRAARALSIARSPDLASAGLRARPLAPWEGEPPTLPDPDDHQGEAFLRWAPGDDPRAGDVIDAFDAWLGELRAAGASP